MTTAAAAKRISWGGARPGAGRPAKHAIASEPHKVRPAVAARLPLHVTARVVPAIRRMHTRRTWQAVRRALATSLARSDFRIVHLAIERTRIVLVVEAADRLALARGMQGFQVAAARYLNRACVRRGTVFADRYRPRPLITRAAVRAVLATARFTREAWPETWLLEIELSAPSPRSRDPDRRSAPS